MAFFNRTNGKPDERDKHAAMEVHKIVSEIYGTPEDGVNFVFAVDTKNESGEVCHCNACKGKIARQITVIASSKDEIAGVRNLVRRIAMNMGIIPSPRDLEDPKKSNVIDINNTH